MYDTAHLHSDLPRFKYSVASGYHNGHHGFSPALGLVAQDTLPGKWCLCPGVRRMHLSPEPSSSCLLSLRSWEPLTKCAMTTQDSVGSGWLPTPCIPSLPLSSCGTRGKSCPVPESPHGKCYVSSACGEDQMMICAQQLA